MPAIQAEKRSEKTSKTTSLADIPLSDDRSIENREKTGFMPDPGDGQKQGPMRFGNTVSEPCSFQDHTAITSLLPLKSKSSLTKALSEIPDAKLRELFKLEANTHKAMMQRVAAGKSKCVKQWRSLRPFLVDVLSELGRRPSPAYTLDRINNDVRRYGPGLCRWALPEVQNNNRSCSVSIKHPITGELLSAAAVAAQRGISNRHARRLIRTKTAAEIFAAEPKPTPAIDLRPASRRGWYDALGDWHDKDEEDAYWSEFYEHFGPPPAPRLRPLPLTEDQLGLRGPDEEWLLIDEELRQERRELSRCRYEEEALREAKAALARVHSGEEPWLDFEHWWVLRGAKISLRKDADWEQFVSDNPNRF